MDHADIAGRMAGAATNFLAALDAGERTKAVIDFGDNAERDDGHIDF